jgi:hypothetical protein
MECFIRRLSLFVVLKILDSEALYDVGGRDRGLMGA